MTASLLDSVRLIRSENVGPVTFFQLLSRYGSPSAALEALPALARRGGKKTYTPCAKSAAEEEIARTESFGARLVAHDDADYPPLLRHVADRPPVLALTGHAHLWRDRQAVAIVGARNASANGCQFARKLSRELGEAGMLVISGLARGIDTYAHQGALASGTIGVIAGGIDNVYPPENRDLYAQLRQQGAVISEQAFGSAPASRNFPARNRIISGMSRGVLVVEASKKSGSLITGRMAADQGREVFAVPGSPMDPRAQGCNLLIREGAQLTESVDDILNALRSQPFRAHEPSGDSYSFRSLGKELVERELDAARTKILELLGASPVTVDTLIDMTGLPTEVVLTVLLENELAGTIQRHPGNRVSLVYQ